MISGAAKDVIKKTDARRTLEKFSSYDSVVEELEKLTTYWENLLSIYQIESDNKKVNRMVNIWNQYQCMITFNLSRSASYFESGTGQELDLEMNQDILGFVHLMPEELRKNHGSCIYPDGRWHCIPSIPALTKEGNDAMALVSRRSLWLIGSTLPILKQVIGLS